MPAVPGLPPGPPLPRAGAGMARFDMIVRDRQPGTDEWSPFGGGSRRCLGASFALMEMRGVIRDVLSTTELEPARPGRERAARRGIVLAPAQVRARRAPPAAAIAVGGTARTSGMQPAAYR